MTAIPPTKIRAECGCGSIFEVAASRDDAWSAYAAWGQNHNDCPPLDYEARTGERAGADCD